MNNLKLAMMISALTTPPFIEPSLPFYAIESQGEIPQLNCSAGSPGDPGRPHSIDRKKKRKAARKARRQNRR
jgi:hypothetical protein